jgi:hypothetical protein
MLEEDGAGGPGGVRAAELVAALSLGIDLGFGQPMEHVLRQCLIALKLAERAGLDEESRAVVYYTALLVNVGCHTDAHEQAKWFGDDIAMKSRKYNHDMRSVRGAASAMSSLGAGHPPLHRFRLGVEFALSGHHDLDGMIGHHAKMTRLLAEQLGLADAVLDGVGAAYERWDGRAGQAASAVRTFRCPHASLRSPSSPRWHTASAGSRQLSLWPARAAGSSLIRR